MSRESRTLNSLYFCVSSQHVDTLSWHLFFFLARRHFDTVLASEWYGDLLAVGLCNVFYVGNFPWILWSCGNNVRPKNIEMKHLEFNSLKSSSSRLLQKKRSRKALHNSVAKSEAPSLQFRSTLKLHGTLWYPVRRGCGQLLAHHQTLPETDMAPCIETSFPKKKFIFQQHFFGLRLQFHASHLHRFLECIWIFHQCTWLGPRHGGILWLQKGAALMGVA